MINFIPKFKNLISKISAQKLLPANPLANDIFLVSYPKSGNTWLRFLLANAFKIHYNLDREVNFFSLHDFIPDIHAGRHLPNVGIVPEIPRVIKSHSAYNPYYIRVILLVRHPRDVMLSYYNFNKQRNKIPSDLTISEFIRHRRYGIDSWLQHTQSWYRFILGPKIIRVFRYEDLIANPNLELTKYLELIGIETQNSTITEAIKLSSKEAMKESEQAHLSTYFNRNKDLTFVNHKNSNNPKFFLSKEDVELIKIKTKNITHLLGYKD